MHWLHLPLEYFGLSLAGGLYFYCLGFSGDLKVLATFSHFTGLLNLQHYIKSFIGFKFFSATKLDFKA